ncbi:type VI secretion system secreted protein VgrG [Alteromonadaceae bacterium 2753L.S.0a.02]|nr:type VI secretion system secreted protein VgrG [Alteromonadaceae bacterium 2753L.S.0a.02]
MSALGESQFIQDNRFLRINSALGSDTFFLKALRGNETFSRLFTLELDLLSYEKHINPADIVGTHIATFVDANSEQVKCLNGYVSQFEFTGKFYRGTYGYRAILVPWFWFLKKRINCRVFQNKTFPEIFEEICGEFGFQDYRLSLSENHAKLEYCVQYRESDFDFLSRIMEREGIYYFFEHKNDKHIMCLADAPSAHSYLSPKEVEHNKNDKSNECISDWAHSYNYLSGTWKLNDFDYEKFNHSLLTETSSVLNLKNAKNYFVYDYPGNYQENTQGKKLAQYRMEAEESHYDVIRANSNVKNFECGKKFTLLSGIFEEDNHKAFVISEIHHEAYDNSFTQDKDSGDFYKNTLRCISEKINYRPGLLTPGPRIDGVQTAVVVGKSGDEIYTDEYGRIKIQFHWDTYGKKDENSSCWIRVATQWAGKKWGTIGIPRVGQEVVVTFEEGDPDRPLVLGCVYNSMHMPPFDLPGDKNVRGVKSRSTKGGSRSTYNEISFDDTSGSEKLTIHAQKDFNMDVGKDAGTNAKGNATNNVDGDVTWTIGGNNTFSVSGNDSSSVGGDQSNSISGNKNDTVSGNQEGTVGGNETQNVSSNQDVTIGSNQTINVGSNQTSSIGSNQEISVGSNQTISVGSAQDISAAKQSVSISGNASMDAAQIALTGKSKISLSVGGSNITIDGAGVTISVGGSTVKVDMSGVTVSGPMVKLN